MSHIEVKVNIKRSDFELDVDLALPDSGISIILGPSGSGKSTLLRLIAGLEKPDNGYIRVRDTHWANTELGICRPAQQRRVGMVFQDYALFNHLTVAANVGFGLPRKGRHERVNEWLSRLHLTELAHRYPHQLSGGQKQRVALARVLATEPDVLLLDEPFSALDIHLRHQLREELLEIVGQVKQPVLLVSHDLDDARYLADNIGVMVNGRLQQLGKPHEVFDSPHTLEVARVLGWRNLLPVRTIEGSRVSASWGSLELEREPDPDTSFIGIRSEHIRVANAGSAGLQVKILRVSDLGSVREILCQLPDGTQLELHRPWNEPVLTAGHELVIQLPLQHIRLLKEASERKPSTPAAYKPSESGDEQTGRASESAQTK